MLGLDIPVGAGPVRASALPPGLSVPHPAASTAAANSAPSPAPVTLVIAMC
ncbi:hypothetical protein [Streptomyces sp. NBC_01022]|uniref:hypothetical protein n=1 Tax=Streptomyces sp. NBC_01022 TaxID=2903723 RepID=UPI002DDC2A55|nr:hypothetical protein [Streptomyces sp. NBC_01022]WRZ80896.1 hypothetical protein OG316_11735 [Streptomyces sp. NBC_01022]